MREQAKEIKNLQKIFTENDIQFDQTNNSNNSASARSRSPSDTAKMYTPDIDRLRRLEEENQHHRQSHYQKRRSNTTIGSFTRPGGLFLNNEHKNESNNGKNTAKSGDTSS